MWPSTVPRLGLSSAVSFKGEEYQPAPRPGASVNTYDLCVITPSHLNWSGEYDVWS